MRRIAQKALNNLHLFLQGNHYFLRQEDGCEALTKLGVPIRSTYSVQVTLSLHCVQGYILVN